MKKAKSRFGWVRGVAATAFTLLYFGILMPSLMSIKEFAVFVAILLVPLTCIHFGADRNRYLEFVGWVLLFALFVFVTQG